MFGSLHSLGYGVRASWASEEDYDEAARYSRDLWIPETLTEETEATIAPAADPDLTRMDIIMTESPPTEPTVTGTTPAPSSSLLLAPELRDHSPVPLHRRSSSSPPPDTVDIGFSVSAMRQLQLSHLARPLSPPSRSPLPSSPT